MTKGLFALIAAGTLMIPPITSADEGTVGLGNARQQTETWEVTSPAIRHIDITPWVISEFSLRSPKVEALLGPKPQTLGPFLVQPSTPPRQFF